MRGRRDMRQMVIALGVLIALLAATFLSASVATAGRNQYYVDAVTIRVDRAANRLFGTVVADSVDEHFCTSSGDWPVHIRRVQPGRDRKLVGTRTNFRGEWRVTFRSDALQGKRVYAQVPSFPNPANGYCNGARSRIVRAP
jgi:hypothetical protein